MSVCLESRAKLDAKQLCDHVNELRRQWIYSICYVVEDLLIPAHRLWSCNCRYHTVVNFVSSPITFSPPTVDTQECMTSKKTRRKTLEVNMFLVSTIITNHTKPHRSGYRRTDNHSLGLWASQPQQPIFFPIFPEFFDVKFDPPFCHGLQEGLLEIQRYLGHTKQNAADHFLVGSGWMKQPFSKIMGAISLWHHWVHHSTSLHFPAMPLLCRDVRQRLISALSF